MMNLTSAMWPNVLILLLLSPTILAFSPSAEMMRKRDISSRRRRQTTIIRTTTRTSLYGGGRGLFGLERKKGNNNGDNDDDDGDISRSSPPSTSDYDIASIVPAAPSSRVVMEIPVKYMKRGGLRFVLGLYLVGLPDKGTWTPNQAADDSGLDMHFKDGSAMFKLVLDDDAVRVDRYGQRPSLAYLLQESVVLHGILDELHSLCSENDDAGIEMANRLLLLEEPGDAIEKARATLPARRA